MVFVLVLLQITFVKGTQVTADTIDVAQLQSLAEQLQVGVGVRRSVELGQVVERGIQEHQGVRGANPLKFVAKQTHVAVVEAEAVLVDKKACMNVKGQETVVVEVLETPVELIFQATLNTGVILQDVSHALCVQPLPLQI